MIQMLFIAFLVATIEKTGFLLTPDIEDIIYVKEEGEASQAVEPKKKRKKNDTAKTEEQGDTGDIILDDISEEPATSKTKANRKPKAPDTSVLMDNTESVLQQNMTKNVNKSSNSVQSEILNEDSINLDYDDIASFASSILEETHRG